MKKDWKEELIQNIKDCGQSLIDNAEKMVGDYEYSSDLIIILALIDVLFQKILLKDICEV